MAISIFFTVTALIFSSSFSYSFEYASLSSLSYSYL